MEKTLQLRFVFVRHCKVFFITSQLFSYNDIFFMTLGLRSFVVHCFTYVNNIWNNVWKLRLVCVRHCDVFLMTLQLRYLFVRCSYVLR